MRTVALVGHNPSIGELTHVLDDGDGEAAARQALEAGFPTGTVAVFDLTTAVRRARARHGDAARPRRPLVLLE